MHIFKAPNGTAFNYNSDGSGEALILPAYFSHEDDPVAIPIDDLVEFVSLLVRTKRIAELEQMTGRELLGLND